MALVVKPHGVSNEERTLDREQEICSSTTSLYDPGKQQPFWA